MCTGNNRPGPTKDLRGGGKKENTSEVEPLLCSSFAYVVVRVRYTYYYYYRTLEKCTILKTHHLRVIDVRPTARLTTRWRRRRSPDRFDVAGRAVVAPGHGGERLYPRNVPTRHFLQLLPCCRLRERRMFRVCDSDTTAMARLCRVHYNRYTGMDGYPHRAYMPTYLSIYNIII